ncbi:CHAD domain-containing protein [Naasia sp. SYSU D00948]|uniref:CHAD domain-containing protein n=1 Tax=Naasia sp. SYSU D00948 TaxID=2817379 RepID=UPI001B3015C2|nr:CHAD domain-containing protein [Naasia sp. SYSU D00948]
MTGIRDTALGAVRELTASLAERAPGVARGEREALHDVRVAVRRLRSILRAAAPAFDGETANRLEARLQDLGRDLGTARDREVLAAGLRRRAATSMPGVLERPADSAARSLRGARAAAVSDLSSRRFLELLDDLRSFAEDPPPPSGHVTADDILERDLRRVRRRAKRAEEPGLGGEQREARLHDVRKAAKRLRYDLSAFGDGHDESVRRLRQVAERVQDALGERRDALAVMEVLAVEEQRATGRRAEELGRLRREEERRASAALAAYGGAVGDLF